jgi:hypothetical protein
MHKTHLERLKERHDNAFEFLDQIFPLEGADLAYVDLSNSSGFSTHVKTHMGCGLGRLNFTVGVKDGQCLLQVLAELTVKATKTKFRADLVSLKAEHFIVRKDESHTSTLRNGIYTSEIHCVFDVHYNRNDCITAARNSRDELELG